MTNTLVVPFLNEDPLYAHGVEFGMPYARMKAAADDEVIADYFSRANQD